MIQYLIQLELLHFWPSLICKSSLGRCTCFRDFSSSSTYQWCFYSQTWVPSSFSWPCPKRVNKLGGVGRRHARFLLFLIFVNSLEILLLLPGFGMSLVLKVLILVNFLSLSCRFVAHTFRRCCFHISYIISIIVTSRRESSLMNYLLS